MFWKKKPPNPKFEEIHSASSSDETPKTFSQQLDDAASVLAESLLAYEEAAYRASRIESDPELIEAQEKVHAARKLIEEGRLAFALGRCLPEHIKYWPSWSQRTDFQNWVGFSASDIVATSAEVVEGARNVKVTSIDFTFKGTRYRLVLRDRGMSFVPESTEKLGEVELFSDQQRVAKFEIVEDIMNEYSQWEFSDVRALKVGPWMKDVIDMSVQIQASDQKRRTDFLDDRTRDAAREIDLG